MVGMNDSLAFNPESEGKMYVDCLKNESETQT